MAEKQRSALLSRPEGTVVLTVRLLDALTVKKNKQKQKTCPVQQTRHNNWPDVSTRLSVSHTHTHRKRK